MKLKSLVIAGLIAGCAATTWAEVLQIEAANNPGDKAGNRRPARVKIDFREVLNSPEARVDPQSLQLHVLNADGSKGPGVPVRFDDPDPRPRSFLWAYIGGGGQAGDLVFQHITTDAPVTKYVLEFTPWDNDRGAVPPSPAPQIGDYDILRYATDGPLSGNFHTKAAVCDWYGDGSICLLAADTLGRITVYRRLPGTVDQFDVPMLLMADGKPVEMSWMTCPEVTDWNGDGLLDLIIGDESSGIYFLENVGERGRPILKMPVPVNDRSGAPIRSPFKPVAEMSFFTKDYAPAPVHYDYDHDGVKDLVFGGYITGQIFWYKNLATNGEMPALEYRGVINGTDGEAIDVTMGATPTFADLDGDGVDELISGHIAEDKKLFGWSAEPSVLFWQNVGTPESPVWQKAEFGFPSQWADYPPDVTFPRIADWDGDGLPDIVLAARSEIFWFQNVGSRGKPAFEYRQMFTMRNGPLLLCPRFNAISPWLGDLDGDGLPDLIRGGSGDIAWARMREFTNAPVFEDRGFLAVDGERIYHEFPLGDDTTFPILYDMDGDGLNDLLVGDGDGYVTLYRNIGTPTAHRLSTGERLLLSDGSPLCVGIPTPEEITDFDTHSGNRSVPAAGDFVGDGQTHLICSNASGEIYFYKRQPDGRYAAGQLVDKRSGRIFVCSADWNNDGRLDLLLTSEGVVYIYLNDGPDGNGVPRFTSSKIENTPWIPYPRPIVMDWDQDGDLDLLLASSYALLHFAERDFLEHGYIEARIVDGN